MTTALGWASVLLFGSVPQSRQLILALMTLGSLAWVAMLLGVLIPEVGTLLLIGLGGLLRTACASRSSAT